MNMRSSLNWLSQLALRRTSRPEYPDPADMGTAFGLDFSLDPSVRLSEPVWVPGRADVASEEALAAPVTEHRR